MRDRRFPPSSSSVSAAFAVAALLLAATPAAASGPYSVTATTTSQAGPLVRTEFLVQAGAHPLDRFKMVRLAKDVPPHVLGGSILFLPPLGLDFSFYEQRDESGGMGSSIAEFFALRNFDVYGYSPRFADLPAGTCEAGLLDCSVMAGWDLRSMVDDIAFVRAQIEQLHPGTKIVAGGASLGGILALAVANAQPADYDGILPWEGMLASPDPIVQGLNQAYCAALEAQIAGGGVVDGVSTNVFKAVTRQAKLAPSGPNAIPLFPSTLTGHQVMVLLLAVSAPGPVTMPVPNYIQMNGSFAEDRLFFADEARVFENVGRFNSYVPVTVVRDISCSLAGVETAYTSNLGSYTGSVLAIGGGRGFGPFMAGQLAMLGSTDVTFLLEPEFGHIDHFMTDRHREFVEHPILAWARRVLGD
ncbi:MAG TPA: hypothetical protein VNJ70_05000 [Thermoanaerobaculia bacterium]|nr:hypothetical protein [Thermoanaerobaculia bacterium]